ncbi:hypothetical protein Hanom_Chr15g01375351 [Helianthus anomalus]
MKPHRLKCLNQFATSSHELATSLESQIVHRTCSLNHLTIFCCVYDATLPKMVVFKEILEFIKRLPIQKALTNQDKVFKSHVAHFWKNASYDEVNDFINSSVSIDDEDKAIIIT